MNCESILRKQKIREPFEKWQSERYGSYFLMVIFHIYSVVNEHKVKLVLLFYEGLP